MHALTNHTHGRGSRLLWPRVKERVKEATFQVEEGVGGWFLALSPALEEKMRPFQAKCKRSPGGGRFLPASSLNPPFHYGLQLIKHPRNSTFYPTLRRSREHHEAG